MIAAEDIINTLSNCKFKKIQLPISSKFSQFDCYETKRREMELLVAGIKSLTEMSDIGEALNCESILDELANQYGAHNLKVADPGSVLGSEKLATATIDYDTYLNYQENELVSAPPALMELVSGIAPTQRVFLYGLKNPESFYKAVLVANRPDFITKTKQNRVNDIFTFKREIGMSVRDPARVKEYLRMTDPLFNPDMISANLVDKETYVDDALAQATADFIERSVIVIDLVAKTFKTYQSGFWKTDQLGDAYTLIQYQGAYLPLIHVDTRNLLNGDALAIRLVSQFEHINREQYKFRDLEIMSGSNRQAGDSGDKVRGQSITATPLRSALNDPYFDPAKMVTKSEMTLDDIQAKMAQAAKNKSDVAAAIAATKATKSATKTVTKSNTDVTNTASLYPVANTGNENLKTAKLAELQEIANGLGIDINTTGANGKPKKKTKENLVADITTVRTVRTTNANSV